MNPEEYELMFRVEGSHWWYLGMQAITENILSRYVTSDFPLDILDAGCGTGGAMTTYLSKFGRVTGIDLSPLALGFCKKRRAGRLGLASLLDLPFASAAFDLVVSLDVLYEDSVPDDRQAVDEFFRVLRPGGRIFLRLPALNWLRGQHDRVIHTARRYYHSRLSAMLNEAGFKIELLSYANMFLFPFAMVKRMFESAVRSSDSVSDLTFPVGPLNGLLARILAAEAPLIPRFGLPIGLSLVAVARRP